MFKRWMVVGLVVMALVGMGYASVALAQAGRGGGGGRPGFGGRGGRGGGFGQMDPEERREQVRQRMMERMREVLAFSEQEWKVVGPRVEKVYGLSRQLRGRGARGMMRMMFGGRGGRGPGGRGGPGGPDRGPGAQAEREREPLERATDELQEVLENEQASADQIKQKLTALRRVEDQLEQEMDKAQEQLRQVVTVRQEAQLVLMGLLD